MRPRMFLWERQAAVARAIAILESGGASSDRLSIGGGARPSFPEPAFAVHIIGMSLPSTEERRPGERT